MGEGQREKREKMSNDEDRVEDGGREFGMAGERGRGLFYKQNSFN